MIELQGIGKTFRKGDVAVEAVKNIDLRIGDRDIVSIIGPSGCGKSTLLNMIAGLYVPTTGRVLSDKVPVTTVNTSVGYMTQKDNLLPWRTVRGNVVLPLELQGVPRAKREEEADRLLARVGLTGFEDQFPTELSGGMRKRTCLARMLLAKPATLLLDEPFAALDAQLKLAMHQLLLELVSDSSQTVVLVTHDLIEAITLSSHVVVCTKRPGQISLRRPIDLPYPRDVLNVRFTERFKALYHEIWETLRREYEEERI
jgi:NitT/TauT family transport system ATP-binding protein